MLRWKRGTLPAMLVFGLLLLTAASVALATNTIQSNDNVPVLRAGAGARALGMGGAFVGVADDATAAYWNPAGLAWTTGWEITGMYTAAMNYDRTHNYVAVSHNTAHLAYALQWINSGMSSIPGYNDAGIYTGDFKYGFNALSLSLAKQFDIFSLGITGKYLRQGLSDAPNTVQDDSNNGFGLDLGAGVDVNEWARLGLSVQNVAGKLGSKDVSDNVKTIPATLRAGVSVMPIDGLTAAFDLEKTRDEDYRFHAGGEFAVPFTDQFGGALRLGLNHDKFAGGLGLRYNILTFDYAYVVEPEKFLDENHRFSVSLNFGREEAARGPSHIADRDGDGIPDDTDQCPDLAEDFDGFADTDGCPDLDNDGDGIPDVNDDCPNKPEDFDGYQDTDGCPDGGAPAPGKAETPAIPPIPTLAYINFKFATAEISGADPIPVLEDVARIMKDRPDIKLQITGHTDNVGSDDSNMKLSIRRAEAVKAYLVKRGVDPDRIMTQGKGEGSPLDTNDTEIGRARNRRIEFSIIQ